MSFNATVGFTFYSEDMHPTIFLFFGNSTISHVQFCFKAFIFFITANFQFKSFQSLLHVPWNQQVSYLRGEGFMTIRQPMVGKIVCNRIFGGITSTSSMGNRNRGYVTWIFIIIRRSIRLVMQQKSQSSPCSIRIRISFFYLLGLGLVSFYQLGLRLVSFINQDQDLFAF